MRFKPCGYGFFYSKVSILEMGKFSNAISVDGYNPLNKFNLVLAAVSGCAFGIIGYGLYGGSTWDDSATYALSAGIVCFAILLFRNRKLKSVPKMIIWSVVSSVLGILVALIGIVVAMLWGTHAYLTGDTSTGALGNAARNLGNAANNANNGNGFTKQDDLNAQMNGWANAEQYQNSTGLDGHNINPDDPYTRV